MEKSKDMEKLRILEGLTPSDDILVEMLKQKRIKELKEKLGLK